SGRPAVHDAASPVGEATRALGVAAVTATGARVRSVEPTAPIPAVSVTEPARAGAAPEDLRKGERRAGESAPRWSASNGARAPGTEAGEPPQSGLEPGRGVAVRGAELDTAT